MPETDPDSKMTVFLCHAVEDKPKVRELYEKLKADGFSIWFDEENLLPGQDWRLEIQKTLRASEAIVVCLSKKSVSKEGYVQAELKQALEILKEKPEGTIFVIPVLLSQCAVPYSLESYHRVEVPAHYDQLVKALRARQQDWAEKHKKPERKTAKKSIDEDSLKSKYPDLPPGSRLPFLPNNNFTGRENELKQLAEVFLGGQKSMLINQALTGMGGIGKTQLAVEFALQNAEKFKGVHWVDASKPEAMQAEIAACGREMNLQPWPPDNQPEQQARVTLQAWKASGPRLVILDNFEDIEAARKWLPSFYHHHLRLLITSRQSSWPDDLNLHALALEVFSETESRDFLRRYLPEIRASEAELRALWERLGCLPLALEMAARYLEAVQSMRVAEYIAQVNLEHKSLHGWKREHGTATRHDVDVADTFSVSWKLVTEEKNRRVFMAAGYCPANTPLPVDVLQAAAELETGAELDEALDYLSGLALLKAERMIHPLLAEFAQAQDSGQVRLFQWARALAWLAYPTSPGGGIHHSPERARLAQIALPRLQAAAALREDKESALLCFHTAFLLIHFGDLEGAMKLYQRSLEIKEGLDDLQGKSATLHQMAYIYVTRGDLEGAMKLYQQSLEITETLGDLKTKSDTLHAMANVYVTRGNLEGAMQLYQQSLEASEGLGDLQGKSATLHEMAGIYVTRGNLEGAMQLYQQSLEITETLGDLKTKSATLVSMGVVLFKSSKNAEALQAFLAGMQGFLSIGAKMEVQQTASWVKQFKQVVGAEVFATLWKQVTGNAELPDWLASTDDL